MKKIIIYFLVLIAGMTLNGCYDLDTFPGDGLPVSHFWQTEEHAKEGMMGIYAMLRNTNVYGRHYMFDHCGELAIGYDQMTGMPTGGYNPGGGEIINKWQSLYEGVQSANHVIRQVADMTAIDDNAKAEFIAEAKFMRALYYFNLLDLYGGVPYYDETTDVAVEVLDMMKLRETADNTRSYIISDLSEAVSKLKVSWDDANYGRATKGAAYALRGKVYLYNKQWKEAIADFEEVVYNKSNNYGYALEADYSQLFKLFDGKTKSDEMIFSLQNKGGTGNSLGIPIQRYMGSRNSYDWGCWNNTMPSSILVDMYEYPDGKPFDWEEIVPGWNTTADVAERSLLRQKFLSVEMSADKKIVGLREADTAQILNVYKNRDPRLMATVIVPYSIHKGWYAGAPKDHIFALDGKTQGAESAGTMYNNANWHTYFYRKFIEPYDLGGNINDVLNSPVTYPVIRLADVLLMLAEAYNEDGQLDKAIVELNKVRARSSVHMPGLNSGPVWLAVNTKEEMFQRIRKERAVELSGEGHNYSDLRRWGWDIVSPALTDKNRENIYGEGLYWQRFMQRDFLWPIPTPERDINPDLQQNPDW